MISCILLSAGSSSRFGSPKALARLNQTTTVIEHIQKVILASQMNEIIIVLGDLAEQIKPFIFPNKKTKVIYNENYRRGQTSSFKAGLSRADTGSLGVMLVPVDYPLIQNQTFRILTEKFLETTPSVILPSHNGKNGHPPIFHARLREQLLLLDDSTPIHTCIRQHTDDTVILPVNDIGVVTSFNTPQEFEQVKACWNQPFPARP